MIFPIIYSEQVESLKTSYSEASSIAAGGQTTFDSTAITTGKTGKLLYALITSSVPIKAELRTVENSVPSVNKLVDFGQRIEFKTPNSNLIKQTQVGTSNFRIIATNLDVTLAANIYCTFVWDEQS